MPRPRTLVEIPPGEAVFIVEALILDGRLDPRTLAEYRTRYQAEISTLESRIARLRALAGPLVPATLTGAAVAAAAAAAAPAVRRAARRVAAKVSPERMRTRELQGRYLALMRQIPKTVVKQRFGKDAIGKKGKEAVLAEMEKYVAANKK